MTSKQTIRLADGRELHYFDDVPGLDRSAPDRRRLTRDAPSSEVRRDALSGEYVAIAGHRQARTFKPSSGECPLDPSSAARPTEIPSADYDVVVFENRFPSFAGERPSTAVARAADFDVAGPGVGRCEVVCFTSDHQRSLSQLPLARVETVIDAWIDRTHALSQSPGVEYVFVFENRGDEIGVTLAHPHGQIYGYPFVPPRFARMLRTFDEHMVRHGTCLQCDIAAAERTAGTRVVIDSEHFLVYVPFAAKWPFEVRVVPHRHVPDLPALDAVERRDLAAVHGEVLRRFDGLFPTPTPYISGWQQAPVRASTDSWHLANEVFTIRRAPDKLKYLAGSESGAGVWVNDVTPEQAAACLRGET